MNAAQRRYYSIRTPDGISVAKHAQHAREAGPRSTPAKLARAAREAREAAPYLFLFLV